MHVCKPKGSRPRGPQPAARLLPQVRASTPHALLYQALRATACMLLYSALQRRHVRSQQVRLYQSQDNACWLVQRTCSTYGLYSAQGRPFNTTVQSRCSRNPDTTHSAGQHSGIPPPLCQDLLVLSASQAPSTEHGAATTNPHPTPQPTLPKLQSLEEHSHKGGTPTQKHPHRRPTHRSTAAAREHGSCGCRSSQAAGAAHVTSCDHVNDCWLLLARATSSAKHHTPMGRIEQGTDTPLVQSRVQ